MFISLPKGKFFCQNVLSILRPLKLVHFLKKYSDFLLRVYSMSGVIFGGNVMQIEANQDLDDFFQVVELNHVVVRELKINNCKCDYLKNHKR